MTTIIVSNEQHVNPGRASENPSTGSMGDRQITSNPRREIPVAEKIVEYMIIIGLSLIAWTGIGAIALVAYLNYRENLSAAQPIDISSLPHEQPYLPPVLVDTKNRPFGVRDLFAYAEILQSQYEAKGAIPFVLALSIGDINDAIENACCSGDVPIFIPVILESNHIVLITLNSERKEIEYFDPRGKKLEGEKSKIKGLDMTPSQFAEALKDSYPTTVSNLKKYEKSSNSKNSGIYVAHLMKTYADTEDFETACKMKTNLGSLRTSMDQALQSGQIKIGDDVNHEVDDLIGDFGIIDVTEYEDNRFPIWGAIKNLLALNERLVSSTVMEYATYLEKIYGIQCIQNLLPEGKREIENIVAIIHNALNESGPKPVFVPMILEGVFGDHIVLLSIDGKNKKIEYFDSQGKSLESEKRKIGALEITPQQLVEMLDLNDWEVNSNMKKYQKDSVNCGVYVSRFMKARATCGFNESCSQMEDLDLKRARWTMVTDLSNG